MMTNNDAESREECLHVSGSGYLFSWNGGGIGAMSGTIDGVGYSQPSGERKILDDGSIEATGSHYFLDKDGSVLHTSDRAVLRIGPNGDGSYQTTYTVVWGTGRFAGYTGSFNGRGILKAIGDGPAEGHRTGAVHYEGRLVRG